MLAADSEVDGLPSSAYAASKHRCAAIALPRLLAAWPSLTSASAFAPAVEPSPAASAMDTAMVVAVADVGGGGGSAGGDGGGGGSMMSTRGEQSVRSIARGRPWRERLESRTAPTSCVTTCEVAASSSVAAAQWECGTATKRSKAASRAGLNSNCTLSTSPRRISTSSESTGSSSAVICRNDAVPPASASASPYTAAVAPGAPTRTIPPSRLLTHPSSACDSAVAVSAGSGSTVGAWPDRPTTRSCG